MQNGKTIWAILGTLFVAAVLSPTWQWYFDHVLDSITGSGSDVDGAIGHVARMMSPIQKFLFGAVAGMLVAVVIGYWNSFGAVLRRISFLALVAPQVAWQSRPTRHYIYRAAGFFKPNEEVFSQAIPAGVHVETIGIRNRDEIFFNRLEPDAILLKRGNGGSLNVGLEFENNVFGRWLFWRTMKRLWLNRMWELPTSQWNIAQAFEYMKPGAEKD